MRRYLKTFLWFCMIFVPLFLKGYESAGPALDIASAQEANQPNQLEMNGQTAQIIEITGPIGPATADYLSDAFQTARERNAAVIVLLMDTPGGLAESMRAIIQAILDSPIPVAGYVYPSGARAASAGTYILYASHVAAMAPGTNLGAATPIQVGRPSPPGIAPDNGDKQEEAPPAQDSRGDPMENKLVNDAVAYIRSLAQLRGRNEEWAEKSVRQGASLPVQEAVRQNVVDLSAGDINILLDKIHGNVVVVRNQEVVLKTRGLSLQRIEPGWFNRILFILSNPNVAMILMLIGVYGLIFEIANPGTIGPGVFGLICLLLGFYALNILPLNYAGLALLILAVLLMTAEAFVPSFGVLGIGGIAAFIIGASILIDTDAPGFRLSWWVIIGAAVLSGSFLIFLIGYVLKAHRRPITTGSETFIGKEARVLHWSGEEGYVEIAGERWRAYSIGHPAPGDRVKVVDVQGLTLFVETK